MTEGLLRTLAEHAMGNYRALINMAAALLAVAAQRELSQLDEKLYLEVFTPRVLSPRARAGGRMAMVDSQRRVGGLRHAPLCRTRIGTGLSLASRGHRQQPADHLRRARRHLPVEGLPHPRSKRY